MFALLDVTLGKLPVFLRFFDPLDPVSIADGIAAVSTDRAERARLSALASANAARFSWDAAAEKLEQLF